MRFGWLLLALSGVFVIQPLTVGGGILDRFFVNLTFVVAVGTAAASVSGSRAARLVLYASGGMAFVLSWCALLWSSLWIELATHGCYFLFFGLTCINVLKFVFSQRGVDANGLYAVCCVYLLAGIAWAFLYGATESFAPGSFSLRASLGATPLQELIYFSLVTLTTLGYGDVTPVSPFARTCATLEAMAGQMYLAVLVAQLVGSERRATMEKRPGLKTGGLE